MQNSKFIKMVTVIDPDTKLPCEVEIRKLDNGALVGLDGAFLAQSEDTPYDPYDGRKFKVEE